jgi:hypothetical protein
MPLRDFGIYWITFKIACVYYNVRLRGDDGSITYLWNVGILHRDYTVWVLRYYSVIFTSPTLRTHITWRMSWLMRLVADLSPFSPGFAPMSIHVGFAVDKVALGQIFLRVLRFFSCQYHFTVVLHTHISPGVWTICPLVAAFQRLSLIPSKCTYHLRDEQ